MLHIMNGRVCIIHANIYNQIKGHNSQKNDHFKYRHICKNQMCLFTSISPNVIQSNPNNAPLNINVLK